MSYRGLYFQFGRGVSHIEPSINYSSVPNRRAGQNKHAGGKILKKTLNVQDRIDMQEKSQKCSCH